MDENHFLLVLLIAIRAFSQALYPGNFLFLPD
jgi:hypothetical protein